MADKGTKRFTIDRGRDTYELTVVGKTGLTHVHQTKKKGKDDHFTNDESGYRRAIENAVKQNSGA